MKVGLVQYNPDFENKNSNQKKIIKLIESVKTKINLFVFPEMTLTGYTMKIELSEELNTNSSPSLNFFSQLAREYSSFVIAGVIEKSFDTYFNTLIVINPKGDLIRKYRKIHLFSYANEDKFYSYGISASISKIENWQVGLSICYDLRFPELFREYALKGVELIVNIANWPDTRIEHYVHLLKARAIENQCYILGVNRVGKACNLNYNGMSSVFDPLGNEIAKVTDKEEIIICELDIEKVYKVRSDFPFLNDIKLID